MKYPQLRYMFFASFLFPRFTMKIESTFTLPLIDSNCVNFLIWQFLGGNPQVTVTKESFEVSLSSNRTA